MPRAWLIHGISACALFKSPAAAESQAAYRLVNLLGLLRQGSRNNGSCTQPRSPAGRRVIEQAYSVVDLLSANAVATTERAHPRQPSTASTNNGL